jgi:Uma2 family endonuclease
MATVRRSKTVRSIDYPTSDGKPMAETRLHMQVMIDIIQALEDHFAADPMLLVGGNQLLCYEEGNRRRHVSPDVYIIRGVSKLPLRENILPWVEGKAPDVIMEITSKTTRREDQTKKHTIYRDLLKIPEYFQFDPTEDYLKPSLQGVRLIGNNYEPIIAVDGRLPSEILGLHLERSGNFLKLWDPARRSWLLTPGERVKEQEQLAEQQRQRAEAAERREAMERQTAEVAQQRLAAEIERLRLELEAAKRGSARPEELEEMG